MVYVRDLMTSDVRTCRVDQWIIDVATSMNEAGRGLLVVVDTQYIPRGVITDTDIIRKIVIEGMDPRKTKVAEVMTDKFISISPTESATDAAQKMFEYKIKRLPVVEGNHLVGIISHKDLLETFLATKKKLLDLAIGF